MLTKEYIKELLDGMPTTPGVYRYYDTKGNLLYVGKAVNLRRRVSSYFKDPDALSARIRLMVSKIADVKYVLVDTERDALLLENNFIKELHPKYNVLLKDDKTYPWITIRKEKFPRVSFVRKPDLEDGSEYYGPYTSVFIVRQILEMLKAIYPLRHCNLSLEDEAIQNGKYKECLDFHIGRCKAPCAGKQTRQEYMDSIEQIRQVLKGNVSQVIAHLKDKIVEYAEKYEFEKAAELKNQIEGLDKFRQKSVVVHPTMSDMDVFNLIEDGDKVYVNFMKINNGAIIQSHNVELLRRMDETAQEVLLFAVFELRKKFNSNSSEILVPIEMPQDVMDGVRFTIPKIGDKHKLMLLSEGNIQHYKSERLKQEALKDPEKYSLRILEKMKEELHLKEIPYHIECFDNSNLQGTNPVSSCVVFKNARPSKKDYRKFKVKTVEGPDDFATMKEVVNRRYSRLLEENQPLPQLVIVDGGKGQLSSTVEEFEKMGLRGKIAVIGLAKRLEEIYFPGDSIPLYIDKHSQTLKVIQHLRDEAHRFGITFHRDRRSKSMLESALDDIKGIGPATKKKLLMELGYTDLIKSASVEELAKITGKAKAMIIYGHFHGDV